MLLILDDDMSRINAFLRAGGMPAISMEVKYWASSRSMIAELPMYLRAARLISLDHDLYTESETDPDPGTGREVAEFLARIEPVCPVLIHSSNTNAAWGMYNALEAARWPVELVSHLSEPDWVLERWLPVAVAALGRR